jgi:hypothetical protein
MGVPVESGINYRNVPKMGTLCTKNGKNNSGDAGIRGRDCKRGSLAQFLPHSVFERFFPATAHQTKHSQA